MFKDKKNKIIFGIIILVLFLVISLIACFILFNKNDAESLEEEEKSVINNFAVDYEDLEDVLKIIGVTKGKGNANDCLNYYLSNYSYGSYYKNIISYYVDAYGEDLLKTPSDDILNSDACGNGSNECYSISKKEAKYIYDIYNFGGSIEDYFVQVPDLKDDDLFFYSRSFGKCKYNIVHNINARYNSDDYIIIEDVQKIKEYKPFYGEKGKLQKTYNKEVTYKFKENKDGNYYLHYVNVN